ncbi:MAG TPA: GDSL-type esterase/lipase family protein [Anaerolineaceae bacterium]|nr:GDSL-type esterase/lipase family protein [Anaerolineaceae bacterium]
MPITVLSILFIVTLFFLALSRWAVERIETNHYLQRADFFRRYPVNRGDIVFLGDSITDGGCWEELFPGVPLKNRGINADDTHGVLKRLDEILIPQPRAIFLLIGTNDLPWFTYRNDETILKTYSRILDRCRALSPDTVVYIQSLLPRRKSFAARIRRINTQLEALAEQHGYPFINLYPAFADPEGALQASLTNDHLHLMAEGYTRWVEILRPHIDQLMSEK